MTDSNETEVLVVGAGPVGMLTALFLTQQGVRTRVIDQEARTATRSYACALHPSTLCVLERAGILDDVLSLGRSVGTIGLYEGHERTAEACMCDLPSQYPFAVVLPQFLLEELLEERLRRAGVRVEWHRRLREIERGADAVVAFIDRLAPPQDGRGVPPQDATPVERLQVRAEFVVGADGHDSMLRQLLGIASLRAGSPQPFAVFEIETIEPLDHEMKLVIGEWGLNVCWPLAENQCRWSFQILPVDPGPGHPAKERDRPIILRPPSDWDSSHRLRRFLAERAPWFKAKLRDILWVASVQFEQRLVLHFGEGRCWLAGDAAHQSSPAGMHSLNLGLQEAADLAGKLKGILRDHSDKDVLQEYDRHHRAEAKRLLGMKAQAPGGLSLWAQRQYATLLGNLPVSGGDLDLLLEKL